MAKIILSVDIQKQKAMQGLGDLEGKIKDIALSLSTVSIKNTLTSDIDALTAKFKTLADQSDRLAGKTAKQAIENERLAQAQIKTQISSANLQTAQERLERAKILTQTATVNLALVQERLAKAQKQTQTTTVNLQTAQERLKRSQDNSVKSANTLQSNVNGLQKKYANLLSTIKSLEKQYPAGTFDKFKTETRDALSTLENYNIKLKNGEGANEAMLVKVRELTAAYNNLVTGVSTARAETDKHTSTVEKNTDALNKSGDTIGSLAKKFLLWQVTATLVMKPLRLISDALSSINETLVKTEDTVISLQRVLPSGSASDDEISSRLYKIAQNYGQTFENVSQIAQNFARTGMDWADTIKATEAAVLALNVAELDAEEATTGMIAILSQFNLEVSDLEAIIDKINKTADNFPVTTEKILAALQRTGSAASNANLSFEETISLVTALSKATGRSGENIGTALNSLIQYSSKSSALDVFAGLSDKSAEVVANYRKGAATILDVWKQVSKEIQSLDSRQADLLDSYFTTDDGAALSEALDGELQDIYTELGGVYDTANTFRKNYFIALLGNMDTVEQAMGTLNDAQGYSQEENQKYLDTYTAKLNSLQAKWQEVANDEQGLLAIKKDLLDVGGFVLDIIQGVGGLKTALIALGVVVGTIVATTKGAQIVAGLQLVGKTIKSLTIDALPNFIATLRAWRGQTTLLNGQVVKLSGSIATFGQVLKSALPIITMVIIAMSALDSAIRNSIEEKEEADRKAIKQQNEAIAKVNENVEAQKKEVAQINEVASSVENLRKILDDSSQSEEEKAKAQDKLLEIQNTLVESNNAYKDSLDLTNGSLNEQLGLIEQLTTEQLKQKANDFLTSNSSEIEIAKNRLESTSTTNTDMLFSGEGWDRHGFRDTINSAISGAGVGNVASINEDNTYGFYHNYGKRVGEGFKKGFWDGVGELLGFGAVFDEASYVGEANAGFSFSGTVEQQIEAITKLKKYIAKNKDTLGLSAGEVVSITTELDNKLSELNSEEYKQAQLLAEKAKATQDWLNGTIDEAEYLKIVYGIEKDISKEVGEQTNDISKVTSAYDDLISKLKELQEAQKESTDWEEKKKAVLDAEDDLLEKQNELIKAQQALENAKNKATARRYNTSTGQWEWQVDEKKVAEAEENVNRAQEEILKAQESIQNAQLALQESAYGNIIDQLKKGDATNESILAILQEVAPLLGADSNFVESVTNAFKDKTGVDITKPTDWNGTFDGGGIAGGSGYMAKPTTRPETVIDPNLTAKILSPKSNAEFDRFVKDVHIMFGGAQRYSQSPMTQSNIGNADNRIDNSGQFIVNGMTVNSEEARTMSIIDLLSLGKIIPNQ